MHHRRRDSSSGRSHHTGHTSRMASTSPSVVTGRPPSPATYGHAVTTVDVSRRRVKCFVRVRPFTPADLVTSDGTIVMPHAGHLQPVLSQGLDGRSIRIHGEAPLAFDGVFDPSAELTQILCDVVAPAVSDSLKGLHTAVLLYGQTGSGKTYTTNQLLPAYIEMLLRFAEEEVEVFETRITMECCQLYLEAAYDLLDPSKVDLQLREFPDTGVFVRGLTEVEIRSGKDFAAVVAAVEHNRATGATRLNQHSSRSHCVFTVNVTRRRRIQRNDFGAAHDASLANLHETSAMWAADTSASHLGGAADLDKAPPASLLRGRAVFVDLAGSERLKKSHSEGLRQTEAQYINQSLAALGNVMHALTDPRATHVPYRDSKLTRLLQDAIGGRGVASVVIAVSPSINHVAETRQALAFGMRAMEILSTATAWKQIDGQTRLIEAQEFLENRAHWLEVRVRQLETEREQMVAIIQQQQARLEHSGGAGTLSVSDVAMAQSVGCSAMQMPCDRCFSLESQLEEARSTHQSVCRQLQTELFASATELRRLVNQVESLQNDVEYYRQRSTRRRSGAPDTDSQSDDTDLPDVLRAEASTSATSAITRELNAESIKEYYEGLLEAERHATRAVENERDDICVELHQLSVTLAELRDANATLTRRLNEQPVPPPPPLLADSFTQCAPTSLRAAAVQCASPMPLLTRQWVAQGSWDPVPPPPSPSRHEASSQASFTAETVRPRATTATSSSTVVTSMEHKSIDAPTLHTSNFAVQVGTLHLSVAAQTAVSSSSDHAARARFYQSASAWIDSATEVAAASREDRRLFFDIIQQRMVAKRCGLASEAVSRSTDDLMSSAQQWFGTAVSLATSVTAVKSNLCADMSMDATRRHEAHVQRYQRDEKELRLALLDRFSKLCLARLSCFHKATQLGLELYHASSDAVETTNALVRREFVARTELCAQALETFPKPLPWRSRSGCDTPNDLSAMFALWTVVQQRIAESHRVATEAALGASASVLFMSSFVASNEEWTRSLLVQTERDERAQLVARRSHDDGVVKRHRLQHLETERRFGVTQQEAQDRQQVKAGLQHELLSAVTRHASKTSLRAVDEAYATAATERAVLQDALHQLTMDRDAALRRLRRHGDSILTRCVDDEDNRRDDIAAWEAQQRALLVQLRFTALQRVEARSRAHEEHMALQHTLSTATNTNRIAAATQSEQLSRAALVAEEAAARGVLLHAALKRLERVARRDDTAMVMRCFDDALSARQMACEEFSLRIHAEFQNAAQNLAQAVRRDGRLKALLGVHQEEANRAHLLHAESCGRMELQGAAATQREALLRSQLTEANEHLDVSRRRNAYLSSDRVSLVAWSESRERLAMCRIADETLLTMVNQMHHHRLVLLSAQRRHELISFEASQRRGMLCQERDQRLELVSSWFHAQRHLVTASAARRAAQAEHDRVQVANQYDVAITALHRSRQREGFVAAVYFLAEDEAEARLTLVRSEALQRHYVGVSAVGARWLAEEPSRCNSTTQTNSVSTQHQGSQSIRIELVEAAVGTAATNVTHVGVAVKPTTCDVTVSTTVPSSPVSCHTASQTVNAAPLRVVDASSETSREALKAMVSCGVDAPRMSIRDVQSQTVNTTPVRQHMGSQAMPAMVGAAVQVRPRLVEVSCQGSIAEAKAVVVPIHRAAQTTDSRPTEAHSNAAMDGLLERVEASVRGVLALSAAKTEAVLDATRQLLNHRSVERGESVESLSSEALHEARRTVQSLRDQLALERARHLSAVVVMTPSDAHRQLRWDEAQRRSGGLSAADEAHLLSPPSTHRTPTATQQAAVAVEPVKKPAPLPLPRRRRLSEPVHVGPAGDTPRMESSVEGVEVDPPTPSLLNTSHRSDDAMNASGVLRLTHNKSALSALHVLLGPVAATNAAAPPAVPAALAALASDAASPRPRDTPLHATPTRQRSSEQRRVVTSPSGLTLTEPHSTIKAVPSADTPLPKPFDIFESPPESPIAAVLDASSHSNDKGNRHPHRLSPSRGRINDVRPSSAPCSSTAGRKNLFDEPPRLLSGRPERKDTPIRQPLPRHEGRHVPLCDCGDAPVASTAQRQRDAAAPGFSRFERPLATFALRELKSAASQPRRQPIQSHRPRSAAAIIQ